MRKSSRLSDYLMFTSRKNLEESCEIRILYRISTDPVPAGWGGSSVSV